MYKELITDVFFDLDHTLWDFEKNSALTFTKILEENKVGVKVEDFLTAYIPINHHYWKLFREEKISKEDLRFQRLQTTFRTIGYNASDKEINLLAAEYINHLSSFNHLFPNAIEILEHLKPNYKLHIITNGFQDVQNKKIRNSKIDNYFDVIVDSEMAGVKKPNPYIFELALQKANTTADKSLMIGDSVEADILGAKSVGLHTLHFNAHQEPTHNHCAIINSLDEIKSYL
ncbi:YjjG family noncanonical pyrimidine nucleotidase [Cellulophaga sp. 20_2_10]|uniref:YjjG family noncanonical pyrimidine nucleotidase n=1 Tax=Cellulophaga sp. 20_2_10 TaxID=2942476 RepID=UPI00201A3580|nr:YjjG family noncanonical pyrimidine nucleotidase [Cellulophaga sp. 20_2_10]MCL5245060.1 YjjG family noncanonical pyrimidine nucleotidase [Cellulophaga sp. 20_2_10]